MAKRKTAKAPRKTVAKAPRKATKKASVKTAAKTAPARKSSRTGAPAANQSRLLRHREARFKRPAGNLFCGCA